MIRILALATSFLAAAVAPALAGSWGFGIGFGEPVYVEPPPYYYEPPVVFEGVPPPIYSQGAPVAIAPDGRPVLHMEAADDVLDALARTGYREFGPMHMRGHFYTVSAVDPNGDLVELEISIFTGEIVAATLLQTWRGPPMGFPDSAIGAAPSSPAIAAATPAHPTAGDRVAIGRAGSARRLLSV